MNSNHQRPTSNETNDAWDALLELTPAEREQFVTGDPDQAMMLDVHRGYRRSAADPEFSDRLLASLLEREVVVPIPARTSMSSDDALAAKSVRRPVWRSAPVWGYVTIALIVGLLAISAAYTFDLSGDDADPVSTLSTLGTDATVANEVPDSETSLAAVIAVPPTVDETAIVLTRVTLAPGVSYVSRSEGSDVVFAESGTLVDSSSSSLEKVESLTSPFEVKNAGTDDATILVVSLGESNLAANQQEGITFEPMSATPVSKIVLDEFTTGSAIVELTQGTGSGSVATQAGSATSVFSSVSGGEVVTSGGTSYFVAEVTPDGETGTPASMTTFDDQDVASSVVEYVEVNAEGESPWYFVSIVPVAGASPATPASGAGGG